jgi:hypothetical protein
MNLRYANIAFVDRSMNGRALVVLLADGFTIAFVVHNDESAARSVPAGAHGDVDFCLGAMPTATGSINRCDLDAWFALNEIRRVVSVHDVPFDTSILVTLLEEMPHDGELLFELLPLHAGGEPLRIRAGSSVALAMPCPGADHACALPLTSCAPRDPDPCWQQVFTEGVPTKPMRPVATVTKDGVEVTGDPFFDPSDTIRPTLDQLRARAAQIEAERPKLYSVADGFGYTAVCVARNEAEAETLVAAQHEISECVSWHAIEIFEEDLVHAPRLAAAFREHPGIGVLDYQSDDARGA